MRRLLGKRIYLDANAVVYFGEGHAEFGPLMKKLFELAARDGAALIASELTLSEVLVMPLRLGRKDVVEGYLTLLTSGGLLRVMSIDRPILIASASLRAESGGKLPDAIHIASAIAAKCEILVSEDQRIRPPAGIDTIRISELKATG